VYPYFFCNLSKVSSSAAGTLYAFTSMTQLPPGCSRLSTEGCSQSSTHVGRGGLRSWLRFADAWWALARALASAASGKDEEEVEEEEEEEEAEERGELPLVTLWEEEGLDGRELDRERAASKSSDPGLDPVSTAARREVAAGLKDDERLSEFSAVRRSTSLFSLLIPKIPPILSGSLGSGSSEVSSAGAVRALAARGSSDADSSDDEAACRLLRVDEALFLMVRPLVFVGPSSGSGLLSFGSTRIRPCDAAVRRHLLKTNIKRCTKTSVSGLPLLLQQQHAKTSTTKRMPRAHEVIRNGSSSEMCIVTTMLRESDGGGGAATSGAAGMVLLFSVVGVT